MICVIDFVSEHSYICLYDSIVIRNRSETRYLPQYNRP